MGRSFPGKTVPVAPNQLGISRTKRLLVALGLNGALVVGEVISGLAAHSTALLADAGHNLADVVALGISLLALRFSLRRATSVRSFGYHRATILAALANMGMLFVVSVAVAVDASWRLGHVGTLRPGLVIIVATISAALNLASALLLIDRGRDLNLRSAMVHLGADALAAAAIAVAGCVEYFAGRFFILDPIVSLVIAVLIAIEAVRIGRASVDVLLESVPADVNPVELAAAIAAVAGVDGVHDLHCWSLSGDVRALSAHVLVSGHPSLEEAHIGGDQVKQTVRARFAIAHATLELECEPCEDEHNVFCDIDTPASA
jgi:cobalt-zinc-cadmium efflux system protein